MLLVSAPRSITAAWQFGLLRSGYATGDSDAASLRETPVPQAISGQFWLATAGKSEQIER